MLKATGYLEPQDEFGDEERQAALLLHHFMRVTFYNSHETTEVEKTGPSWSDNSLQKIGRATNPTLALINHGCDPNYDRVSWGRITLGFACKPIAAGEEIVDTYCQPFVVVGKEERRQRLAKYNFSCACNACKHNWPRMNGLEERVQGLPEKEYKVPKAALAEAMNRVGQAEAKAEKVMDHNDDDDDHHDDRDDLDHHEQGDGRASQGGRGGGHGDVGGATLVAQKATPGGF